MAHDANIMKWSCERIVDDLSGVNIDIDIYEYIYFIFVIIDINYYAWFMFVCVITYIKITQIKDEFILTIN